jgi:hypothetical protein
MLLSEMTEVAFPAAYPQIARCSEFICSKRDPSLVDVLHTFRGPSEPQNKE